MRHRMSVSKAVKGPILLAALGYFVDIYDLILFSIVRIKSLKAIGVPDDALLSNGVHLINMQMIGMLLGGILWGILGDKRGRLSVLLGSILLYSLANIANGFVHSVEAYAILRFIAGLGLAGELGAGVTLVSEIMPKETRGYGTTIVAGVGILGGVAAGLIGDLFDWRTAYFIGGGMGLALLTLRIGVYESGMFEQLRERPVARGDFKTILASPARVLKYVCSIFIGLPIWFILGILVTFSPEFGKALGMPVVPSPARAVMFFYIGCTAGDFFSGVLSQYWRSRRRVVLLFLVLSGALTAVYLLVPLSSLPRFYFLCSMLGIACGYWAMFVTMASEQFGTNIRATVTTTAPNFVRGALVPTTLAFQAAKGRFGILAGTGLVGGVTFALAFLALAQLEETFGKDLDYCD
ncbi:MAG: MFS transporter [Elusimicrobia bacterium]|nr:MFS transporter [Elusimicrobiota bacterium]